MESIDLYRLERYVENLVERQPATDSKTAHRWLSYYYGNNTLRRLCSLLQHCMCWHRISPEHTLTWQSYVIRLFSSALLVLAVSSLAQILHIQLENLHTISRHRDPTFFSHNLQVSRLLCKRQMRLAYPHIECSYLMSLKSNTTLPLKAGECCFTTVKPTGDDSTMLILLPQPQPYWLPQVAPRGCQKWRLGAISASWRNIMR
jgi:hypothetical protein